MNIRKNDTVLIVSGKYKGRRGRVLRVFPQKQRVLIEGINMIKRHTKPTKQNQQGGIVEKEAPIHVSNVMPWCEAANAPSRIIIRRLEDGTRVRTYKINNETLND